MSHILWYNAPVNEFCAISLIGHGLRSVCGAIHLRTLSGLYASVSRTTVPLLGICRFTGTFLYISIALAAERSCMAEVHVFGRVTNDLQLKMSHRQVPYVSFGLVEWIGRRDTGHRQYFEVWAWGTAALSLADAEIHKDSRIWVQGFLELVDCTRNGGSEKDKRLKLSLTGWQTKPPRAERTPARKQSPGAAQPPLPPVEVVDGDRERLPE